MTQGNDVSCSTGRFIFSSSTAMSEADFLAEVECFLGQTDLPELPLVPGLESSLDRRHLQDESARQQLVKTRRRKVNPATKRELEKAQDRKRRARYRERRQNERARLLDQVAELSAELKKLQNPSLSMAASAWKLLAQHQLRARVDAKAKQRRLRAEIDVHVAMIHNICFRLSEADTSCTGGLLIQNNISRLEPANGEAFEALLHDLDDIHARTNEALGSRVADTQYESWSESWKEGDKTGTFLCRYQNVVSTDFQQSCRALWDASQLPHQQNHRQRYGKVADCEKTAAFKFRVTTNFGAGTALAVTCVSRRYELAGRLVIVWKTLLEGEGGFAGLHANETGWGELTPVRGNATLMRICIDHEPMHFSSVATHEPTVKQFTAAVLDSVFEDGADILKQFDNLRLTAA